MMTFVMIVSSADLGQFTVHSSRNTKRSVRLDVRKYFSTNKVVCMVYAE